MAWGCWIERSVLAQESEKARELFVLRHLNYPSSSLPEAQRANCDDVPNHRPLTPLNAIPPTPQLSQSDALEQVL
jgi:hypothetical protein